MKIGIIAVWIGAASLGLAGLFCPGSNAEHAAAAIIILTVAYFAVRRKKIVKT